MKQVSAESVAMPPQKIGWSTKVVPFRISNRGLWAMAALWLLLYLEPLQFGGVSLSQMWKGGLVLIFLLITSSKVMPKWYIFGTAFAAKQILFITLPVGFMLAVQNFFEALFFPALLAFLTSRWRNDPDAVRKMYDFSLYVAIFFLVSAIPFVMGLESLYPARDLAMWGLDRSATTGLFYSLAPASQTYLTATLIIIVSFSRFSNSAISRLAFVGLVALGTYLIYFSFTRTGWFVYAGGLAVLLFFARNAKYRLVALALIAALGVLAFIYLWDNEAFWLRMGGGATYRRNVEFGLDSIVASRFPFILTAIDNLNDQGIAAWLIGYGPLTGMMLFEARTGMAIDSHNGTFVILESSGIVGLTLYALFLAHLWSALRKGTKQGEWLYMPIVMGAYCWVSVFLLSRGLPLQAQAVLAGVVAAALIQASQGRRASSRKGVAPS